jgi:allantoinase
MFDLVVRGDLVLPDRVLTNGFVAARDGTIGAIGVGDAPEATNTVDATGSLIFPGVIDGQVHAGSAEGIDGLGDASIAAAAGGVTTIVDMPFDDPLPVNSAELLQTKVERLEQICLVDVALYGAPQKGAGTNGIAELAEAGVCAFKVSTYEYHPVRFPGYSMGEMYELFPAIRDTGLSVAFHNEEASIVQRLTDRFLTERRNTPASHGAGRPAVAELAANVAVFEIARATGVRCHIVHSSLARGFDHVKRYRDDGVTVSAETCVQYLVFEENQVLELGARLKQNPPIRPAEEREALWEKIVADEVDFVSSDHVAWPLSRKSDPEFSKNGSGVPGLETLFHALYTGMVTDRGLAPTQVAALLSERPARHFGLYPRKGALTPGADADFAIVKPGNWTFDADEMASKVKWSPYDGMTFGARVTDTYVRGTPVYKSGAVAGSAGHGRFVRPV